MVICQFQFVALFENHVILSEVWRSHTKSKNPFSFWGNTDPSTPFHSAQDDIPLGGHSER